MASGLGSFDPETAQNLEDQMSTYWAILERAPGSKLRLTKLDDEIYESFKTEFPDFDPAATINEDEMKSKAGKEKWRNWMKQYEERVADYNFGTLLRANPKFEYGEKETIFVVRMQFYAIEIARFVISQEHEVIAESNLIL
ncbi:hypothetical protein TRV_00109 [Trichophyton verrucosum HKI 0517]|uniref:Polysaccharide biosynthesis domain-containing protein n=1 Tax=Trichophyton verrucosum (strain HKI 0517) TaxID=663202 RepID=D4CZ72_TRIVH|nr:uncharacterized protein TRV_00109 [Trichophyton verrucosum HKI 0517]EFE45084.1 hypothetical protein TRV_00109 [Trichophyton verrucosum HKI 0517]